MVMSELSALWPKHCKHLIKTAFAGLVVFCSTQPSATAQDNTTIRIATREYLPPYVEMGATSGIEIDLIKAVFAETPYRAVFVQQPRVRMIAAYDDSRVDGILTQNINASNAGCATDWYISHQNVAKTLASRELEVTDLADLQDYAVLSFSGATRYIGSAFRDAIKGAKRYTESGDQGTHISLLYKGRFDVIVGDRWILSLAQKRYFDQTGDYQDLTTHAILPPTYYVARFHDPKICDAFNGALRSLRNSGKYAEIWAGYQARMIVDASDTPTLPQ